MYIAFLLLAAVLSSGGLSLSYKKGANAGTDAMSSPPLMSMIASLLISLFFVVMGFIRNGGISVPNPMSYLYSAGCGIAYALASFFYLEALARGPYTLSVVITNVSSFMPILYAGIFLGERVTPVQVLSILLILTAYVMLTVIRSKDVSSDRRITLKWVIFAILSFSTNGFISFFVRVNVVLTPETSINSFYAFAYVCSALISLITFASTGGFKKKVPAKPLLLPSAGVAGFLSVKLIPNALLAGLLPSAIQYPLMNGSVILFNVLIGLVVFKEKLSIWGCVCIGVIIASMCLLGL